MNHVVSKPMYVCLCVWACLCLCTTYKIHDVRDGAREEVTEYHENDVKNQILYANWPKSSIDQSANQKEQKKISAHFGGFFAVPSD